MEHTKPDMFELLENVTLEALSTLALGSVHHGGEVIANFKNTNSSSADTDGTKPRLPP